MTAAGQTAGFSERGFATTEDGMRIAYDLLVRMDDGLTLSADVFRPDDDGTYPAIVSYGPYAKGLPFPEGYPRQWEKMVADHPTVVAGSTSRFQSWEVVDPERWVPHGYVVVRFDSRGAGRTPGVINPRSHRETEDLYACIEWAAAQPWCTGKVGLCGISYFAVNQWHVAGLQPPHLTAMVPWEAAGDYYRDSTHHGGILSEFTANWYDRQVKTVQHGLGSRSVNPNSGLPVTGDVQLPETELEANRVDLAEELRSRPFDGPWYRERSADWSKVTTPFLSAANWGGQGLHARGNFEAFTQAAATDKWLEVHGLEHWTHFYTDYGVGLQRQFLDHFLKGEDNGWDKGPRVRLNVRHPGGRFVPRGESEWPLARTRWTTVYLDAATRSLSHELPAGSSVTYESLGDGVDFTLPVIEEETELTGPLAASLWVSSSTTDADVFLVVRVFDPAGEEVTFQGALDPNTPVAQGWLRASHRRLDPAKSLPHRPYHPHDRAEPLAPGDVVRLDVEIWPTCIVVPAGYRVALSVRGKDYEYTGPLGDFARTFHYANRGVGPFTHNDGRDRPAGVFGGEVTLYTGGDRPSSLLLPVVPPSE